MNLNSGIAVILEVIPRSS